MNWFVAFSLGGILSAAAHIMPDPPRVAKHSPAPTSLIVHGTPRPVSFPKWQKQPARDRHVASIVWRRIENDR